jgi:hypothetical protein
VDALHGGESIRVAHGVGWKCAIARGEAADQRVELPLEAHLLLRHGTRVVHHHQDIDILDGGLDSATRGFLVAPVSFTASIRLTVIDFVSGFVIGCVSRLVLRKFGLGNVCDRRAELFCCLCVFVGFLRLRLHFVFRRSCTR